MRRGLEGTAETMGLVLGGGRGTRLFPLTRDRSKPAVPLAGKYRLIDVAISNCINSGIRRIYVLTQFNSASLNRHVAQTYHFDSFTSGFVEILAAEQTPETEMWYQGTADAVRKNLRHLTDADARNVLILSGDALYRHDFRRVVAQHEADGADVTVSCKLVDQDSASSFGIVGIDRNRRVLSFHEKPARERLEPLKVDPAVMLEAGLPTTDRPYLASMGIYLFRREVLLDVLRNTTAEDFGKQVIPEAISRYRVVADLFDGYWEDIGTIRAFYHANLDLLADKPHFSFYDVECPIFTHGRVLPASEVVDSHISRALLTEGCIVKHARIHNTVIGIRSVIEEGATVEDSIIMGADYYDTPDITSRPSLAGQPGLGIGKGAIVRNAIVDKNARIGDGARIVNEANVQKADGANYFIRDGIVIIPKSAVIAPGTVI